MRTRRVLIVDDMEANRYVLRKILAGEANFQILEAGTGAEGLELMVEGVDLVILDINLPDMTGFELLQKAEHRLGPSRLPAIINISATFVSGKDKATGLNTGARAYLTHPINPDEVLATITSLLKNSTRMERIERQRNWAEARNEQLSKEKVMLERFMRSFSHDLRSPLSAAVMATGLMQRNPARRTEDLLAVLQENLRRIDEMVGNLLDISHVSVGGGIKLMSESMELAMLLRDAVANLALQLENPLELELGTPELQIAWDRSAFLRIFDNLVGNAAKHGQALKPIRIEQSQEGDFVRLLVTNHGNFPAEVLANLATPYFISSRSDTKGWGLGLPIVKALAESFAGEVHFSNQGDLARVELLLPVALAG
jgi:two-component system sensor histidine kinase/response regulator